MSDLFVFYHSQFLILRKEMSAERIAGLPITYYLAHLICFYHFSVPALPYCVQIFIVFMFFSRSFGIVLICFSILRIFGFYRQICILNSKKLLGNKSIVDRKFDGRIYRWIDKIFIVIQPNTL